MKKEFPILESDRVIIRQFQDSDVANVFVGLSHPDVIKYYGISFNSLEATQAQMAWFKQLEVDETGIWWAVCSKADGSFLGAGGFNEMDNQSKKAEIGFWLLPESWGVGYLTEVMPMIMHYGFNELDLHRIEGFVESNYYNCKKGLKKLQFVHEGTMKDCEIKNGAFISLDIYASSRPINFSFNKYTYSN